MIKKVTKKWLKEKSACKPSLDYVCANGYIGLPPIEFIRKLMSEDRFPDANWFIARVMNKRQRVEYAMFAAKQVANIVTNTTKTVGANAATAAAHAAAACDVPAVSAAYATSAAYAAAYAYSVANGYSADAEKKLQVKIIKNGIKILIEEGEL